MTLVRTLFSIGAFVIAGALQGCVTKPIDNPVAVTPFNSRFKAESIIGDFYGETLNDAAFLATDAATRGFLVYRAVPEHEQGPQQPQLPPNAQTTDELIDDRIFWRYPIRFIAEPMPDASDSLISAVSSALEASVKAGGEFDASGKVSKAVSTASSLKLLGRKSQGVMFLRDAMYRLNEARLNDILDQAQYVKLVKQTIAEAAEIARVEVSAVEWHKWDAITPASEEDQPAESANPSSPAD